MAKTVAYYLVVDTYNEYAEYVSTSMKKCVAYMRKNCKPNDWHDNNDRYIIVEADIPLE